MKIDVSAIEGYDSMSAEEKIAALEAHEFADPSPVEVPDVDALKQAVTKANREAAEYKRQLREKQTEEERRAAEIEEERAATAARLAEYEKNEAISKYKAKYLSLGFDEETAQRNAEALQSGDYDTLFGAHKKHIDAQRRAAVSESLNEQPSLSDGKPLNGVPETDGFTAAFTKAALGK